MVERNKHLCPCGSGKRMKLCCRSISKGNKIGLEEKALRLSKAGMHVEACQAFEQRAALSPTNPMIWNDLGNEYAAAGQIDKAISALKRARELDSSFPLPLYNLGVHTLNRCVELKRAGVATKAEIQAMAEEAIGYFNASLEKDPDNAACHQNIATAYGLTKDARSASAHAMEALRLTPASKRLPNRLLEKAKRLFS